MSYEAEVAAILEADATLDGLLTGGIYTSGTVGVDGITRDSAEDAFDESGWLQPCALVKQRDIVPISEVVDYDTKTESARQIVAVWLYDDQGNGYATLDSAAARIRTLLMGEMLTDSYELRLALWKERERDTGALMGAAMEKLDFQVDFVMGI